MRRLLCFLTLLVFTSTAVAGEISKVVKPGEVTKEVAGSAIPKELEGLRWNRWKSKNFTVCAINDTQAQYLNKHLELVKGWCFARWGLYDIDFSAECKVIGVDDPELFKKLFNLEETRVEIRRDQNGHIKETVIFLLMNGPPSQTVPQPLTDVCMAEFSQKYNVKFGLWACRGMRHLNGPIKDIRSRIVEIKGCLDRNEPIYFSKGLLEMDQESYDKLDDRKKRLFDNCAIVYCLMIRKEFGQESYLKMLKMASGGAPEEATRKVLGFDNYASFDRSFKRYMTDLTSDLSSGKTPDSYLQIKEK